jgi:nucleoside-diphosphate-sugar epimerase
MQCILGSGGAIGTPLAESLAAYTDHIRLVSRDPKKVNPGDELVSADLLSPGEVERAVRGSSIVYVTVGFPYQYKFWQEHWPPFISNVIAACIRHNSKLVFFDNIYMYDPEHLGEMTEQTPIRPASKKGQVRATVARNIMQHVEKGKLTALIARSADFYGPGIRNTSVLNEMVIQPLSKGKKANWMGSVDCKHSYTYTPDAGRATALLGNTADAYNQVWHLPTASDPPTGREWINAVASELDVKPKYRVVSRTLTGLMGIFVPVMKEMIEMMYQYDRDYVFNSEKFNKRFKLEATSYEEGLKSVIKADFQS